MRLIFITHGQMERNWGITLHRRWQFWYILDIHRNPCADPTHPYNNVYIARCPWFAIGFMYGKWTKA